MIDGTPIHTTIDEKSPRNGLYSAEVASKKVPRRYLVI